MVPGKEVESFHISLDKNLGEIKRQQAARDLRIAGVHMAWPLPRLLRAERQ